MRSRHVRPTTFAYPLGLWLVMAVIAVANGIFRETVLVSRVGENAGHVLSTVLLVAAILVLTYVYFTRSKRDYSRLELLLVGLADRFPFWTRVIGIVAGICHGITASAVLFGAELLPTGAEPTPSR